MKVRAGAKGQSGKGEGPSDQQQRRGVAIVFREEAEGETVPGDQVAQGTTFMERTWQGRRRRNVIMELSCVSSL